MLFGPAGPGHAPSGLPGSVAVVVLRTLRLTTYDYQAICWKQSLRKNTKYAWKHSNGAAHVWSGDAVNYFASLADEQYDAIRAEYRELR